MYYNVLVASQRYHGTESLTYSSTDDLSVGQIVQVPLGKLSVLGIVESSATKPSFKARAVTYAWNFVVPNTTIGLIAWLHTYYPAPFGSIVELFTPPALTKTTRQPETPVLKPVTPPAMPSLTVEQRQAMAYIQAAASKPVLLHGDTGTGKTRLYLERTAQVMSEGKSVIITTPEIGLTEPLLKLFTTSFGDRVHITHSGMTAAKRRQQWVAVCQATTPVILLGPRSALFYPMHNLGLVVIDEAHDTAYKQDQAPYYQASRVAAQLARQHHAQLILGTATPLVADYYYFTAKQLPIVRLTTPALQASTKVTPVIVDNRDRTNFSRSPYLSNQLLKTITEALNRHEQVLLFLNRRGSARVVMCDHCGWQAICPRCDTSLTFHADTHNMRCHSCDYKAAVPTACPDCHSAEILFTSIGTKALETEVTKYFPGAVVARFDSDTHKSEGLSAKFSDLQQGNVDIIIGTQSVAKGHDLPKLSVVGIVQADMSLSIPDYTASERTYHLLTQVMGRVGRGHRNGTLVIQTHNPASPVIAQALAKDYASFYEQEITERRTYSFPPFTHLMTLTCTRATAASAEKACLRVKEQLLAHVPDISIEGPSPRFIEKVVNKYSWHLIVRARSRTRLTEAIQQLPSGCIANIDPTTLL